MENEKSEKTICVNCNDFDRCIDKRIQPVFFCEEYDNFIVVPKKIFTEENKMNNDEKPDLHVNCDNKASCVFKNASPEKMFCEEYQ